MGSGRKKIEMKKIGNIENRRVAFSKRRRGMFTKAIELSKLTGCSVAALAVSPSDTPFLHGDISILEKAADVLASGRQDTEPSSELLLPDSHGTETSSADVSNYTDCHPVDQQKLPLMLTNHEHVLEVEPLKAVPGSVYANNCYHHNQNPANYAGEDEELKKLMQEKERLLNLKEKAMQILMPAEKSPRSQGSIDVDRP